jgi:hypothetical protein
LESCSESRNYSIPSYNKVVAVQPLPLNNIYGVNAQPPFTAKGSHLLLLFPFFFFFLIRCSYLLMGHF